MKAFQIKYLAAFLLTFFLFTGVYGRQPDSLQFYLEVAAQSNPLVLQRLAEYEASLQKIPQAGSLPDPELSAGIFLSPMELVGGKQLADVRLMQMFPWFGSLKAAKDEMSLMANARFETLRDAKLQLYYEVQQTYFELQKIEQSVRISEKSLDLLRTIERLSLVAFKSASNSQLGTPSVGSVTVNSGASRMTSSGGMSGMGSDQAGSGNTGGMSGLTTATSGTVSPGSMQGMGSSSGGPGLADVYRVQIEMAALENNIQMLRNKKESVSAHFNAFLNRPPQFPISLSDELPADSLDIPLQSVSDSMLSRHPMLRMLQFEQQSLDARHQMVTKMGYPMLGLGINYSLIGKNPMVTSEMNGNDMLMPMVTVTLPVYRKKYKAMAEEVRLQKKGVANGFQAAANTLENEFYDAVRQYRDAGRRMDLYRNQADLAGRTLNILMKSFSVSGSGLTDLLRIQQQTLDYELRQMEAIADNNTAVARLKQLMADF